MEPFGELNEALRDTLYKCGVLGQLKARIRFEAFQILNRDYSDSRPPLSHVNLVVNELIREYLEYNQYRYTASVLKSESGQHETCLDREYLQTELNIPDDNDPAPAPLLCSMVAHLTQKMAVKASDSEPASPRSITINQIQEENDLSPRSPVSPRSPRQNSN